MSLEDKTETRARQSTETLAELAKFLHQQIWQGLD